jgi:hypothetical protein
MVFDVARPDGRLTNHAQPARPRMGKPAEALDAHALTETMTACCKARQYLAAYRMYRLAFDTRDAYVHVPWYTLVDMDEQ